MTQFFHAPNQQKRNWCQKCFLRIGRFQTTWVIYNYKTKLKLFLLTVLLLDVNAKTITDFLQGQFSPLESNQHQTANVEHGGGMW